MWIREQLRAFDTQEGVYDCAWSEMNSQQLVSACANGSIKLWHLQTRDQFPIQNYHEHKQEVSGVNWNLVAKDSFVSASWDGTIKVWRPEIPQSVATLAAHSKPVYNAVWSTQHNALVASCSGDGSVKVWDLTSNRAITTIQAHNNEVLALDWNKYNQFEVVSGSADCSIKIWVSVLHLNGLCWHRHLIVVCHVAGYSQPVTRSPFAARPQLRCTTSQVLPTRS